MIAASVEEQALVWAKMGIKELKELLVAAEVSTAGCTEKEDLIKLLCRNRAQAAAKGATFVASKMWQRVPDGQVLPPGLEVKFDMDKGGNYARLPAPPKPKN